MFKLIEWRNYNVIMIKFYLFNLYECKNYKFIVILYFMIVLVY